MKAITSITIIVPTRNESGNITHLLRAVGRSLEKLTCKFDVLFIDDSNDGGATVREIERCANFTPNITVIHRKERDTLSGAITDGLLCAAGDVSVVMYCDYPHDPRIIPKMIEEIENGANLVVGTPYTWGSIEEDSGRRKLAARCTKGIAGLFMKDAQKVSDVTSGYFAIDSRIIRAIQFHRIGRNPLLDILVSNPVLNITEVPYTFPTRIFGATKFAVKAQFQYINHLWKIRDGFHFGKLVHALVC